MDFGFVDGSGVVVALHAAAGCVASAAVVSRTAAGRVASVTIAGEVGDTVFFADGALVPRP